MNSTQVGAAQGQLNSVNYARIAEHCGILAAGTIAAYLLTVIPQLDFGKNTAVVAMVLSAGLKFIMERTRNS